MNLGGDTGEHGLLTKVFETISPTVKYIINEIIFSTIIVANKIFHLMDGERDV